MKIQTLSVVVGTSACNAKCPFCVSKTTPSAGLSTKVNWRNFKKACRLAQIGGATTVLLTGKGEPTLQPQLINDYLEYLEEFQFPFIELQTNGIQIGNNNLDDYLNKWYQNGLTTICLSAVHYWQDMNRKIYGNNYPDLKKTVKKLHDIGFTIRLSIMMLKGYVDTPVELNNIVGFCKTHKIKQLTIRPIACPEGEANTTSQWILEHTLDQNQLMGIRGFLYNNGKEVLHLAHGAIVYDYKGQNICLANCLTTNKTTDDMRQIIFFPNGSISYDWSFSGAVLL